MVEVIGFWDFSHHQTARAPNDIELNPEPFGFLIFYWVNPTSFKSFATALTEIFTLFSVWSRNSASYSEALVDLPSLIYFLNFLYIQPGGCFRISAGFVNFARVRAASPALIPGIVFFFIWDSRMVDVFVLNLTIYLSQLHNLEWLFGLRIPIDGSAFHMNIF